MTRRVVSQIAVFILLCTPLLSLVAFLVYSVIPNTHLIILHPLSCALFLMLGLYGASELHQWHRAKRWWYWSTIIATGVVGIVCMTAYLLGLTPPFLLLDVAIAPGAALVFLLLVLRMLFLPTQKKWGRWFEVGIIVLIGYFIVVPYVSAPLWQLPLPLWSAFLCICGLGVISASEDESGKHGFAGVARVMCGIAIVGIVGTSLVVRLHALSLEQKRVESFTQEVTMLQMRVQEIADAYSMLAVTLGKQVETIDSPSQDQWNTILGQVDPYTYPAVAIVSYIPRVFEEGKEAFPIRYATSFTDGLQSTPGFDISTDDVRNSTLRRMIDTGAVIATPLMPDTGMFSLYAPLHNDTTGEVSGVLALTLDREILIRQIEQLSSQSTAVRVSLGENKTKEFPVMRTASTSLGGTLWYIEFLDTQKTKPFSRDSLLSMGYGITVALVLMALAVYALMHKRRGSRVLGTFTIRSGKTLILPVLESLVQEYTAVFAQKKLHFETILPKRIPAVIADATVVRVALETILRNAYEATPIRGTVALEVKTVSIKRVPQSVVISCSDTSIGLSAKLQHALLHKTSTVDLADGIVLESLYTSNHMLSVIGSSLLLSSQEGVGTTVTITLPSAVTEAPKVL